MSARAQIRPSPTSTAVDRPKPDMLSPGRSVAMLLVTGALAVEALIAIFVIVSKGLVPPLVVFAVVFAVLFGAAVARPRPWVYLVAGLLLLAFFAINVPFVGEDPVQPVAHPGTWAGIVTLALCPVAGLCGVLAFRQARSGGWRPAGSMTSSELGAVALVGVLLGAGYVAAVGVNEADSSAGHGVKNGVLQVPTQPTVAMIAEDTKFSQKSIEQKTGPAAIYVTNKDSDYHTFDVDIDGRHYSYPLAAKSTTAVVLDLHSTGKYTFWCAISGHRSSGMEGVLNVAAG